MQTALLLKFKYFTSCRVIKTKNLWCPIWGNCKQSTSELSPVEAASDKESKIESDHPEGIRGSKTCQTHFNINVHVPWNRKNIQR